MRPSDKYLYKGHKEDRHMENMKRPCEVDNGGMWKQAKEFLEQPEARGGKKESFPRPLGEHSPTDTLTLEFWPLEL